MAEKAGAVVLALLGRHWLGAKAEAGEHHLAFGVEWAQSLLVEEVAGQEESEEQHWRSEKVEAVRRVQGRKVVPEAVQVVQLRGDREAVVREEEQEGEQERSALEAEAGRELVKGKPEPAAGEVVHHLDVAVQAFHDPEAREHGLKQCEGRSVL